MAEHSGHDISFGFTQTGLDPGMARLTESHGPYLYKKDNIPALRRGLSTILSMKLLTQAQPVCVVPTEGLCQTLTPAFLSSREKSGGDT